MSSHATPESEVEAVLERFFRTMDEQNFELMKQIVAHDAEMVHIGTDTGEIWNGWDELRPATIEQFDRLKHYKAQIRDLTISVSPSGEVAWYSHLLDAKIKSGGKEQAWQGARFTGVLEKRRGQWRMVQTHVSLPEPA